MYEEFLLLCCVLPVQMQENSINFFHKKNYTVCYGEVGVQDIKITRLAEWLWFVYGGLWVISRLLCSIHPAAPVVLTVS
jgi:hypothetical protein